MSRRKQSDNIGAEETETETETEAETETQTPPVIDDVDRDVDSVIAELGQEASYVVLRRFEAGDWVILDRLDVGDATAVAIKTRYGGGKYRARIHDDGGIFRKQVTFRIGGRSKSADDDEIKTELDARLEKLEKQFTEKNAPSPESGRDKLMEAVVSRLLAPPEIPKVDPLMGTLITALISGRPNSAGIDPVKLQELLQGARAEGYEQGKALGEAISLGGVDGDVSVAAVLAKSIPDVMKAFQSAHHNPPIPVQVVTSLPTPTPTPPIQTLTTEENMPTDAIGTYLRPAVPIILKWARSGKNPEIKAVNMLDDLTDTQRDGIGLAAERDDFVDSIMKAIPEFNAVEIDGWCRVFFSTIQNTVAPPDEETGVGGLEA
ncbi:MAG: hypothetical protein ACR2MF_04060 [Chthoniobacterales bacterium]